MLPTWLRRRHSVLFRRASLFFGCFLFFGSFFFLAFLSCILCRVYILLSCSLCFVVCVYCLCLLYFVRFCLLGFLCFVCICCLSVRWFCCGRDDSCVDCVCVSIRSSIAPSRRYGGRNFVSFSFVPSTDGRLNELPSGLLRLLRGCQ